MSIATLTAALAIFGFAALCFAAAVTDMARFEIPNRFSLTIALLYPAYLIASPNPVAWQSALLLASGVLLAGFLLFVFGTVGGGDVKLLAAATLWVGLEKFPVFILLVTLGGAVLAGLLYLHYRIAAAPSLRLAWIAPAPPGFAKRPMPYAVPIALGAGVVAFGLLKGL